MIDTTEHRDKTTEHDTFNITERNVTTECKKYRT
jgi:hypothetical protein